MTKCFLPNLPINEVEECSWQTAPTPYLLNRPTPKYWHYEQQHITGQGLTVKWRPTENKLFGVGPVAEPIPGSHQSARRHIHSGTRHFTNTVVIPWILMLFLKKHFHIFQYNTPSFWHIVPDWFCVAQEDLNSQKEYGKKPCSLPKWQRRFMTVIQFHH